MTTSLIFFVLCGTLRSPTQEAHLALFAGTLLEIQFQQRAWIVARSACFGWLRPPEAELLHIELADERLNHATHVIGRNKIVQNYREEGSLITAFTLDIAHEDNPCRYTKNRLINSVRGQ